MESTNNYQKVREKYSGLSYEELVETAEISKLSDLEFIFIQPQLSDDFNIWLKDKGIAEYEETDATQFLEEQEMYTELNQEGY